MIKWFNEFMQIYYMKHAYESHALILFFID